MHEKVVSGDISDEHQGGLGDSVKGSTVHWNAWGQHVAIAAAYGACYQLAYHFSVSHWALTVGLRLSCLLLMPTRLWPALALGEFLPEVEHALLCMPEFGAWWSLAASVPQIVLCMAVMKPLRNQGQLRDALGLIQMKHVVIAALCCAIMSALRDTASLWVLLSTATKDWGPGSSLMIGFSAYLLGGYLGALTVTPTILAVYDRCRKNTLSIRAFFQSRLLRDVCIWLAPSLAALAWCALTASTDELTQFARLGMLLPVAIAAKRHGWHGTAIAGLFASVAMAITSTTIRDPAIIHCQIALAFALSAGFLLGGRTEVLAELPARGR